MLEHSSQIQFGFMVLHILVNDSCVVTIVVENLVHSRDGNNSKVGGYRNNDFILLSTDLQVGTGILLPNQYIDTRKIRNVRRRRQSEASAGQSSVDQRRCRGRAKRGAGKVCR